LKQQPFNTCSIFLESYLYHAMSQIATVVATIQYDPATDTLKSVMQTCAAFARVCIAEGNKETMYRCTHMTLSAAARADLGHSPAASNGRAGRMAGRSAAQLGRQRPARSPEA